MYGENCDGWYLLNRDSISIIHEKMPSGAEETKHYHQHSRQLFFVLLGKVTIEINGEIYELYQQEGIEVPPMAVHQVFNETDSSVEFSVISQPTTKDYKKSI